MMFYNSGLQPFLYNRPLQELCLKIALLPISFALSENSILF